jgi:hypothetical protein
MGMARDYFEDPYEPQIKRLVDATEVLKDRLAHYEEEVARLKATGYALFLENDRLQIAFAEANLECDKQLDEAQDIVIDLLATGERLADQLESQQSMPDSHNGWWIPSLATARVWIAQRNKR